MTAVPPRPKIAPQAQKAQYPDTSHLPLSVPVLFVLAENWSRINVPYHCSPTPHAIFLFNAPELQSRTLIRKFFVLSFFRNILV